jgi:hypothetical protein
VQGASSYTIYRSKSFIITVNSSVAWVANATAVTYEDAITANGTYYYVVIATNATCTSGASNCLSVVVAIPPAGTNSPSLSAPNEALVVVIGIAAGVAGGVAVAGGLVVRKRRRDRSTPDPIHLDGETSG